MQEADADVDGALFRTGDTFESEWAEYTVIGHTSDGQVKVETAAGTRKTVAPRRLIEMVTTTKEPVTQ